MSTFQDFEDEDTSTELKRIIANESGNVYISSADICSTAKCCGGVHDFPESSNHYFLKTGKLVLAWCLVEEGCGSR